MKIKTEKSVITHLKSVITHLKSVITHLNCVITLLISLKYSQSNYTVG